MLSSIYATLTSIADSFLIWWSRTVSLAASFLGIWSGNASLYRCGAQKDHWCTFVLNEKNPGSLETSILSFSHDNFRIYADKIPNTQELRSICAARNVLVQYAIYFLCPRNAQKCTWIAVHCIASCCGGLKSASRYFTVSSDVHTVHVIQCSI